MRRPVLFGACLLVTTACAGVGGAGLGRGSELGTGSRDVVQVAEHPEVQSLDLYQAIRRLRPFFLQSRGPSTVQLASANRVAVFLDGVPIGGVSELTSIRARDIAEVRYLSPSEAVIRHGRRFAGGIIKLRTR